MAIEEQSDSDSGCGSLSSFPLSISKQEEIKLCIEKNQELINSLETQISSFKNEDSPYIKANRLLFDDFRKQLLEKNEILKKELEALNTPQQSIQSLSSPKKQTLEEQTLPPPPPPPPPPPSLLGKLLPDPLALLKKMKNNGKPIPFRKKMENYIDKIVNFKIFLKGKIEPCIEEENYKKLESILTDLVDSLADIKKIDLESREEEILKELYTIFSKQLSMELQLKHDINSGIFSEQLKEKDKFIIVYFESIISSLGDLINKQRNTENKNEKLIKISEDIQTNVQALLSEIKEKQNKNLWDLTLLEITKCFIKHLQEVNFSRAEEIIIHCQEMKNKKQDSIRKNDISPQQEISSPILSNPSRSNRIFANNNQAIATPEEIFFSRGGSGRNTLPARIRSSVSVVSEVKGENPVPKLLPKPKKMNETSSHLSQEKVNTSGNSLEGIQCQKGIFKKWGVSLRSKKPKDSKGQENLEGVSCKMKR
ncbi:hypothetical protein [Rickettsiella massiliensis]|uniref:hypothetical protein n=1 Tax=Rickettsiella massiliensis TaxID=676517 RepID=UPI000494E197|nr:hypothetical protein [Rickettsiella massiliensis]